MNYKHCCVIDESSRYIEFVLVRMEPDEGGILQARIQGYTLNDGESLIKTAAPCLKIHAGTVGLLKPKWDNAATAWVEDATEESLAAWERAHPAPPPPTPTAQEDAESLLIDHELRLTLLELGVN